eukprot:2781546-Ditylum_brightwellii.AAC.1
MKILFHALLTDGLSVFSKCVMSVTVSKDLEHRDWVRHGGQDCWYLEPVIEKESLLPVGSVGAGAGMQENCKHLGCVKRMSKSGCRSAGA